MSSLSSYLLLFVLLLSVSLCGSNSPSQTEYISDASGYWPMPAGSFSNAGYSDMATLELSTNPVSNSFNDEDGAPQTPPVIDRDGLVYTIQDYPSGGSSCSVECWNPSVSNGFVWSKGIMNTMNASCSNSVLAMSSHDTLVVIINGYITFLYLQEDRTLPPNSDLQHLGYTSSFIVPLSSSVFLLNDQTTQTLHILTATSNCNCTNSSQTTQTLYTLIETSNCNCTDNSTYDFVDFDTSLTVSPNQAPAVSVSSSLTQATTTYIIVAHDTTLTGYSLESQSQVWQTALAPLETFSSNVIIGSDTLAYVMVTQSGAQENIVLRSYDVQTGQQVWSTTVENFTSGVDQNDGRVSADYHNKRVITMVEDGSTNNTIVSSFDIENGSEIWNVNLGEPNFQGQMSIDSNGDYYVISSQMSGFIALNSTDGNTVTRQLSDDKAVTNIRRNYPALGNGTIVVASAGGVLGYAPNMSGDGGSSDHTWIIVLGVIGGVVLLFFIAALAGLAWHYYSKRIRPGYERI